MLNGIHGPTHSCPECGQETTGTILQGCGTRILACNDCYEGMQELGWKKHSFTVKLLVIIVIFIPIAFLVVFAPVIGIPFALIAFWYFWYKPALDDDEKRRKETEQEYNDLN